MDEPKKAGASPDLKDLDKRLTRAQQTRKTSKAPKSKISAFGIAFRITTDLVCAICVGVGIGWILDNWLSTKPWFLLLFFLLGVAAGLANVIRVAKSLNADATKNND